MPTRTHGSPAPQERAERASSFVSDDGPSWNPDRESGYEALDRDLLILNEKFYDALDGPFAVCGGDKALRYPAITLAGYGSLKEHLPAKQERGVLSSSSDPGPVIERSINLQDQDEKPIRGAWTLDAKCFTIDNRAWHEGVERVVAKAARQLNITVPVKARLQSLRIYDSESMARGFFE
jgi:hypothetical protein